MKTSSRYSPVFRAIALAVIISFSSSLVLWPTPVRAQSVVSMPLPGVMVHPTAAFHPPVLLGVKVYPKEPFRFDFILDSGDQSLEGEALEQESNQLIRYFLASLTIPEDDLWVNLSPYEADRIIPEQFGYTEMGRDMLAQDYLLKQFTASLMYPEDELGKAFWKRVYEKAYQKFGTTNIPINTFNKIWIIPEKAVVYEQENAAYVTDSYLKVMLEEDYLALSHQSSAISNHENAKQVNNVTSEVVREVLIPEIEKEVNTGKNFAQLRQIFNSLILATWYKETIKTSLINQIYSDQKKTVGVDIEDKQETEKIYQQYIKAFKEGVYDFIKEDYDPHKQEIIPRKYFSGGLNAAIRKLERTGRLQDVRPRSKALLIQSYAGQADEAMTVEADTAMAVDGGLSSERSDQEIIDELNEIYDVWGKGVWTEYQEKLVALNLTTIHSQLLVDNQGRGVMILGEEMVGKSTLTANILEQRKDIKFVADDRILLTITDNGKIFAGRDSNGGAIAEQFSPRPAGSLIKNGPPYDVSPDQMIKGFVKVDRIINLDLNYTTTVASIRDFQRDLNKFETFINTYFWPKIDVAFDTQNIDRTKIVQFQHVNLPSDVDTRFDNVDTLIDQLFPEEADDVAASIEDATRTDKAQISDAEKLVADQKVLVDRIWNMFDKKTISDSDGNAYVLTVDPSDRVYNKNDVLLEINLKNEELGETRRAMSITIALDNTISIDIDIESLEFDVASSTQKFPSDIDLTGKDIAQQMYQLLGQALPSGVKTDDTVIEDRTRAFFTEDFYVDSDGELRSKESGLRIVEVADGEAVPSDALAYQEVILDTPIGWLNEKHAGLVFKSIKVISHSGDVVFGLEALKLLTREKFAEIHLSYESVAQSTDAAMVTDKGGPVKAVYTEAKRHAAFDQFFSSFLEDRAKQSKRSYRNIVEVGVGGKDEDTREISPTLFEWYNALERLRKKDAIDSNYQLMALDNNPFLILDIEALLKSNPQYERISILEGSFDSLDKGVTDLIRVFNVLMHYESDEVERYRNVIAEVLSDDGVFAEAAYGLYIIHEKQSNGSMLPASLFIEFSEGFRAEINTVELVLNNLLNYLEKNNDGVLFLEFSQLKEAIVVASQEYNSADWKHQNDAFNNYVQAIKKGLPKELADRLDVKDNTLSVEFEMKENDKVDSRPGDTAMMSDIDEVSLLERLVIGTSLEAEVESIIIENNEDGNLVGHFIATDGESSRFAVRYDVVTKIVNSLIFVETQFRKQNNALLLQTMLRWLKNEGFKKVNFLLENEKAESFFIDLFSRWQINQNQQPYQIIDQGNELIYLKLMTVSLDELNLEAATEPVDAAMTAREVEREILDGLDIAESKLDRSAVTVNGQTIEITQYKNRISDYVPFFRVGEFVVVQQTFFDTLSQATQQAINKHDGLILLYPQGFDEPFSYSLIGAYGASTMGVIASMIAYQERIKGSSFVDFGAGTGILSIIAKKLGANEIFVVENQSDIRATLEGNLQNNGVTDFRSFYQDIETLQTLETRHHTIGVLNLPHYGILDALGDPTIALTKARDSTPNAEMFILSGGSFGFEVEGELISGATDIEKVNVIKQDLTDADRRNAITFIATFGNNLSLNTARQVSNQGLKEAVDAAMTAVTSVEPFEEWHYVPSDVRVVGPTLKKHRLAAGLSIDDVVEAYNNRFPKNRISSNLLNSLETNTFTDGVGRRLLLRMVLFLAGLYKVSVLNLLADIPTSQEVEFGNVKVYDFDHIAENKNIARNLRRLLFQKHIRVKDLEKQLDFTKGYISVILNGKIPSSQIFIDVLEGLHSSVDDLLGDVTDDDLRRAPYYNNGVLKVLSILEAQGAFDTDKKLFDLAEELYVNRESSWVQLMRQGYTQKQKELLEGTLRDAGVLQEDGRVIPWAFLEANDVDLDEYFASLEYLLPFDIRFDANGVPMQFKGGLRNESTQNLVRFVRSRFRRGEVVTYSVKELAVRFGINHSQVSMTLHAIGRYTEGMKRPNPDERLQDIDAAMLGDARTIEVLKQQDPGRVTSQYTEIGRHERLDVFVANFLKERDKSKSYKRFVEIGLGKEGSPTFFEWSDSLQELVDQGVIDRDISIVGIDNNPDNVKSADRKVKDLRIEDHVSVMEGSFSKLLEMAREDGPLDFIRALFVLMHYDIDEQRIFREHVRNALSEGGIFIEGGPNHYIVQEKNSDGQMIPRFLLVKFTKHLLSSDMSINLENYAVINKDGVNASELGPVINALDVSSVDFRDNTHHLYNFSLPESGIKKYERFKSVLNDALPNGFKDRINFEDNGFIMIDLSKQLSDQDLINSLAYEKRRLIEQVEHVPKYNDAFNLIGRLEQQGVVLGVATLSRMSSTLLAAAKVNTAQFETVKNPNSGHGTSRPEVVEAVADVLDLSNRSMVIVDDAADAIKSIANLGFGLVIGVARENDAEALKAAGADLVVENLGDITIAQINSLLQQNNNDPDDVVLGAIFDMDGVLIRSVEVHNDAIREVLNTYLTNEAERLGIENEGSYRFPSEEEVDRFFRGHTVEEGMQTFLQSRGLLPSQQFTDNATLAGRAGRQAKFGVDTLSGYDGLLPENEVAILLDEIISWFNGADFPKGKRQDIIKGVAEIMQSTQYKSNRARGFAIREFLKSQIDDPRLAGSFTGRFMKALKDPIPLIESWKKRNLPGATTVESSKSTDQATLADANVGDAAFALEKKELGELLVLNYVMDSEKAQELSLAINASGTTIEDEGRFKVVRDEQGNRLVEISEHGSKRYFDRKDRWMLTMDPFGQKTVEIKWNENNEWEELWALNFNQKAFILRPFEFGIDMSEVVWSEDVEEDRIFRFASKDFLSEASEIPYSADLIKNADTRGIGVLILNIVSQLALDQGNKLFYGDNAGRDILFLNLQAVAYPAKPTSLLEFYQEQNRYGNSDIWQPAPAELMINPNGAVVFVREGVVERAYYQGEHSFNKELSSQSGGRFALKPTYDHLSRDAFEIDAEGGRQVSIDVLGNIVEPNADKTDAAELAVDDPKKVGGIDFNPANLNLQIKRDADGVPILFAPQELQNIQIDGLYPIIINITPVPNLPLLLGEGESANDNEPLAALTDKFDDPYLRMEEAAFSR